MFVKGTDGELVNIAQVDYIGIEHFSNNSSVVCQFPNGDDWSVELFNGPLEQCQAYMTELEKELAAFGKLIRVEVD